MAEVLEISRMPHNLRAHSEQEYRLAQRHLSATLHAGIDFSDPQWRERRAAAFERCGQARQNWLASLSAWSRIESSVEHTGHEC